MPDEKTSRGKASHISGCRGCLRKLTPFLKQVARGGCVARVAVQTQLSHRSSLCRYTPRSTSSRWGVLPSFPQNNLNSATYSKVHAGTNKHNVSNAGLESCSEFGAARLKKENKQLFFALSFHQILDKTSWRTFTCHYNPIAAMPSFRRPSLSFYGCYSPFLDSEKA